MPMLSWVLLTLLALAVAGLFVSLVAEYEQACDEDIDAGRVSDGWLRGRRGL
jgi:hypothetical protein